MMSWDAPFPLSECKPVKRWCVACRRSVELPNPAAVCSHPAPAEAPRPVLVRCKRCGVVPAAVIYRGGNRTLRCSACDLYIGDPANHL